MDLVALGDDLGPALRAVRQHTGVAQRELAAAAGLAASVLARAEAGGGVTWPTLRRLLSTSRCTLRLLGREGEPLAPLWHEEHRDAAGRRVPAHLRAWEVRHLGDHWVDARLTTVERPFPVPAVSYEQHARNPWGSWERHRRLEELSGILAAMKNPPTRARLASLLDATLLKPEATAVDVAELCRDAAQVGAAAVCVSPSRLPLPPGSLPASVAVCTVVGFPSGAHRPEAKAAEARQAVEDGATELDMVVDLGLVRAGNWDAVRADVAAVREAAPTPTVLKVIVESALLDDDALRAVCRAAEEAGADFVKTSTGFHPSGGHTVHAVRVMAEAVGGRLGIKASGGVRTTEQALAVVEAGATRIGASSVFALLEGLPER